MSLYFRVVDHEKDARMEDVQVLLDMRTRERNEGWPNGQKPGRELAHIQQNYFYLVAYNSDGPLGFVHVQEHKERVLGKVLDMHEFFTLESKRDEGVASKLLVAVGRVADQKGIEFLRIPNYTRRMRGIVDRAMNAMRMYRRSENKMSYSELVSPIKDHATILIKRVPRAQKLETRSRISFRIVDATHVNSLPLLQKIAGKNGLEEFEYGLKKGLRSVGYALALIRGKPVGYTQYSISREGDGQSIKTHETYVVSPWRGKGVAKAIGAHLLRYASTRDFHFVDHSDPSPEMYRVNSSLERLSNKRELIWGRHIPNHTIDPSADYWKSPPDQIVYFTPRKKQHHSRRSRK